MSSFVHNDLNLVYTKRKKRIPLLASKTLHDDSLYFSYWYRPLIANKEESNRYRLVNINNRVLHYI